MKIGYCRVSTADQSLDLQLDSLKKAGCEKIFQDVISGSKVSRDGLDDALSHLREGDTLVVWRLDRLGRSLKHLIQVVEDLSSKNINFASTTEMIDTSSSGGKLIFHIFGAIAEFERNLIRERTQAGLAAARARGRTGGRRKAFKDTRIDAITQAIKNNPDRKVEEICKEFGVSKTTYYRRINEDGIVTLRINNTPIKL
jgi:DNA invertase Pin-like site-specific DNA recombinase